MKTTEPTDYIVDDDAAVLDSISEMVRTMQLVPVCYEDARDFLKDYDPQRPGCLILDLRLPGMSGIELQQKLAELGNTLPVIMVSAHGDVTSSVRAMKLGAIEFLEKPYSPEQLRNCIRFALQRDTDQRQEKERLSSECLGIF